MRWHAYIHTYRQTDMHETPTYLQHVFIHSFVRSVALSFMVSIICRSCFLSCKHSIMAFSVMNSFFPSFACDETLYTSTPTPDQNDKMNPKRASEIGHAAASTCAPRVGHRWKRSWMPPPHLGLGFGFRIWAYDLCVVQWTDTVDLIVTVPFRLARPTLNPKP